MYCKKVEKDTTAIKDILNSAMSTTIIISLLLVCFLFTVDTNILTNTLNSHFTKPRLFESFDIFILINFTNHSYAAAAEIFRSAIQLVLAFVAVVYFIYVYLEINIKGVTHYKNQHLL